MATNAQVLLFVLRAQDEASKAFQGAGLAAASFGFAIGAAAAASVKASVDFNRTFTQMQTLAGVAASEVAGVTEAIKEMALETGRGPQELANAMYQASSAGFTTKEAMDVTKAAAMGAAVGLGSTATVADTVTSALNAYGHENLTAADAVGQLAEAVKLGKGEADQIAGAIGKTINIAAQLGVSFKDVTAATAAMTTTGLTASQSVTAIRQTLAAVYAPTMQARRVLTALGVDYHDLQKTFREQGFLAGIEQLKKVAGTGVNFRMILGDKEAVNADLGLLGANIEHTKEIFEQMGTAGQKSLQDIFNTAAQSNSFKWDQGVSLLKVALLDLGDAVMPIVIKAISAAINAWQGMRTIITQVTGFFRQHATAIYVAAGAVAAFMIIQLLPEILLTLASAIAVATARMIVFEGVLAGISVASIGEAFMAIGTAFTLLGEAALAAVPEVVALAAALWATGIPEVIIAISALVGVIIWFGESTFTVGGQVASGWDLIKATWDAGVAYVSSVMGDLVTSVSGAWDDIVQFISDHAAAILLTIPIIGPVVAMVYSYWDQIKAGVTEAWGAIVQFVKDHLMEILAAIPLLGPVLAMVVKYWDDIVAATDRIWTQVVNTVKAHIYEILNAVPLIGGAVAQAYAYANSQSGQKASGAAGAAFNKSLADSYYDRKQAELDSKFGKNGAQSLFDMVDKAKPKPKLLVPPGPGVADYSPPGHQKKGSTAKTEAEKEQEQIDKTVAALKVQTAAYAQSAEQHEFLENVKKAGIDTDKMAQGQAIEGITTMQQALDITDKQAASNLKLNGLREIARALQQKENAERAEGINQLNLDADMQLKLTAIATEGVRQKAIDTAVIQAQTQALKEHKKALDADQIAAVSKDAGAKFDAGQANSNASRDANFTAQMANIQAEANARSMGARDAAIYIAAQKEINDEVAKGLPLNDRAIAQAKQLAAAQYDLSTHLMTAKEGMQKYMDYLQQNMPSMGDIIYNSMNTAVDGLTDAFSKFFMGQKVGWAQMAVEVIQEIEKMIIKMLIMKAVQAGLKAIGFSGGGSFGGDAAGGGHEASHNAIGNVFGAKAFAAGGAFTNSVVTQATAFNYMENAKRKLGVMGEAGPEAVMPLVKAGGKLSVQAFGADGSKQALPLMRGPDGKLSVFMAKLLQPALRMQAMEASAHAGMLGARKFANGDTFGSGEMMDAMTGAGNRSRASQSLSARGSSVAGGGTHYVEGNTQVSFGDMHITYQGAGDKKADQENMKQLKKTFDLAVDDRVNQAVGRMTKRGGRLNMFGMNSNG
jgi:TP901 family phage tail tape measure protein/lambda family phage tail tape measure protein